MDLTAFIGVYEAGDEDAAAEVVRAGADLVAIDGALRLRSDGSTLAAQIAGIHSALAVPVMADVDSYQAALAARDAGADMVATTLSGYVGWGPIPSTPDLELVARLAAELDYPVVAEGRYWTPDDVRAAMDAGAYAVVVATAITNPGAITLRVPTMSSAQLRRRVRTRG